MPLLGNLTASHTATMMRPLETQPDGSPQSRTQAVPEPANSRIVPKPVPAAQAQDPRGYQIGQLRKRFSPTESERSDGSTSLIFKIAPSDPDFPFELAHLECDLRVPLDYPEERPELVVRNKDIPKGFSVNIERGWQRLAEERKGATLLALTHALDKNLERFLSEQKVETVKLVAFKDTKDTRHMEHAAPAAVPIAVEAPKPAPKPPVRHYVPEKSYTKEQIAEAKGRRLAEVGRIEARMGRLALYRKSADGIVYTLPIEPKRRSELSPGLKTVRSVHLIVPLLYPLQDLRAQLNDVEPDDAEPVEELFHEKAAEQKQLTLMSHVNYLAQNLHTMEKQCRANRAKAEEEAAQLAQAQEKQRALSPEIQEELPKPPAGEKSHVQYIPRPPEWSLHQEEAEESGDSSTESDDTDDGGAAIAHEEEAETMPMKAEEVQERGTMISFPSVELHAIEILQVTILSISVKCERCKTVNDLTGLKPGAEKVASCKKCANPIAAKFRRQLVHEHSTRAGFIDMAGCKVADMLPSTFVPTCARCSTPTRQGFVSVRGETTTNVCFECHSKFTFKIPDVKFALITPGSLPPPATGPKRKQERLGLHAGEPLPNKGACAHYKKSYRWFRFSCCSKVHPCDKCHDTAEDHSNEWANRMICGWCSREQHYAVEACAFCGRSVIGRKGKGFWEGGKGTRDQRMMSRKDPRKYKRLNPQNAEKD